MASLRLWHSYLSVFIAPSVIFFALTGALQIFNFHEAHGDYHPPVLIEKLARVHKDQVFEQEEHHDAPAPEATAPVAAPEPPHEEDAGPRVATYALKWFFLTVALVLTTSTTLGLWIALTHITRKRVCALLLAGGCLVPVALLLL